MDIEEAFAQRINKAHVHDALPSELRQVDRNVRITVLEPGVAIRKDEADCPRFFSLQLQDLLAVTQHLKVVVNVDLPYISF